MESWKRKCLTVPLSSWLHFHSEVFQEGFQKHRDRDLRPALIRGGDSGSESERHSNLKYGELCATVPVLPELEPLCPQQWGTEQPSVASAVSELDTSCTSLRLADSRSSMSGRVLKVL